MVSQSIYTYHELVKARKNTGRLWAATLLLTVLSAFFFAYFGDLNRVMVERKSGLFVKWPLPHYVTHQFMLKTASATLLLGVIVLILWLLALNSLKHCPTLADLEKHRVS